MRELDSKRNGQPDYQPTGTSRLRAVLATGALMATLGGVAVSLVVAGSVSGSTSRSSVKSPCAPKALTGTRASRDKQATRDLKALVAAAKTEGSVNLYWAAVPAVADALAAAFKAKYGITVNYVPGSTTTVGARYVNEGSVGRAGADVYLDAGTVDVGNQAYNTGVAMCITKANLPVVTRGTYPRKEFAAAEAIVFKNTWLLAFNKQALGSTPAPTSWQDLLNPAYRGKIATGSPKISSIAQFYLVLERAYGDTFLRSLAPQLKIYSGSLAALSATVAGETMVTIPNTGPSSADAIKNGAPLAVVQVPLTTAVQFGIVLTASNKSLHPFAGKLLANYMMSPEGQAVMTNGVPYSFSVYDTAKLPTKFKTAPNVVRPADYARLSQLLGAG